jgi:hypothetical protein
MHLVGAWARENMSERFFMAGVFYVIPLLRYKQKSTGVTAAIGLTFRLKSGKQMANTFSLCRQKST